MNTVIVFGVGLAHRSTNQSMSVYDNLRDLKTAKLRVRISYEYPLFFKFNGYRVSSLFDRLQPYLAFTQPTGKPIVVSTQRALYTPL